MENKASIHVELALVNASNTPILLSKKLAKDSSVKQALLIFNLKTHLPNQNIDALKIGIFSKKVSLDHILQDDDRIEIYQPLMLSPEQARQKRLTIKKQRQQACKT
jgi:uncharacterized protein